MKIVLSRKGFDSASGGVASPIFPSGELCSLPIPTHGEHFHSYSQIVRDGASLGTVVSSLTRGRIKPGCYTHLDPDLRYEDIPRREGWRPIFGQAGAAESHLQHNEIDRDHIFLFYGWFRRIEYVSGAYRYVQDAPDLHVIYGWLQIEQRLSVRDREAIPTWALEHQHCLRTTRTTTITEKDCIYISTEKLRLPGIQLSKPGAGTFRKFHQALCLTSPGETRSVWRLPNWFFPENGKTPLTYHKTPNRWTANDKYVQLRSAGRGQEFVLDCKEYPEAIEWLASLLALAD
jgi:hypothetical protein